MHAVQRQREPPSEDPQDKYLVEVSLKYDSALVRCGNLAVWLTAGAIAPWQAPATRKRGGQPIYPSIAIERSLTVRLGFQLPLRRTEVFPRLIANVLKVDIAITAHTTMSCRGGSLTNLPQRIHRTEPLHLLIYSSGPEINDERKWLDQMQGIRLRRRWR